MSYKNLLELEKWYIFFPEINLKKRLVFIIKIFCYKFSNFLWICIYIETNFNVSQYIEIKKFCRAIHFSSLIQSLEKKKKEIWAFLNKFKN